MQSGTFKLREIINLHMYCKETIFCMSWTDQIDYIQKGNEISYPINTRNKNTIICACWYRPFHIFHISYFDYIPRVHAYVLYFECITIIFIQKRQIIFKYTKYIQKVIFYFIYITIIIILFF